MSHDLRSPLSIIQGMARLLHTNALPEAERRPLIGRIVETADRMTTLIQNLIDVSCESVPGEGATFVVDLPGAAEAAS